MRPRGRPRKKSRPITPHFLGSIVIQTKSEASGRLPVYEIVDGQQRLFTLQLLFDAVEEQCRKVAPAVADELVKLVLNEPEHRERDPDRDFKTWPTDEADQIAFRHAMRENLPISQHQQERIIEAHSWFSEQSAAWLQVRPGLSQKRSKALSVALHDQMLIATIELGLDENEQIIFETLNSRGTPLGTLELAKNFLLHTAKDEEAGERNVRAALGEFERKWWEREIGSGRTRRPHAEAFLHHWLTLRTGAEIPHSQTFMRFRRHVSSQRTKATIANTAQELAQYAEKYRELLTADKFPDTYPEFANFVRRWKTLQADVFTPVILYIWESNASNSQARRAYEALESYLVRRLIVGLDTRGYGTIARHLLVELKARGRKGVDTVLSEYLRNQTSERQKWPANSDVEHALMDGKALRRMSRQRVRMILEAIERSLPQSRWIDNDQKLFQKRLSVEHIMPQYWQVPDWAPPSSSLASRGETAEQARNRLIQSIGNLTLINSRDNSRLRTATWTRKQEVYSEGKDKLSLNIDLLRPAGARAPSDWNEEEIMKRSERLAKRVIRIWPRPK